MTWSHARTRVGSDCDDVTRAREEGILKYGVEGGDRDANK